MRIYDELVSRGMPESLQPRRERLPKASACMFSLIETAKANGLEPLAYMKWVIGNIAAADTEEALDSLFVEHEVGAG